MLDTKPTNLAKIAADKVDAAISSCITSGKSFLVEAGAGAGKTYSLIHALKVLINGRGHDLVRRGQRIACITYTNVASEEIKSRTDSHPAVLSSTIHAFCWLLIKDFQPQLRKRIPALEKWEEKLKETGISIKEQQVEYDLGYRGATENKVTLGHNDVIAMAVDLMEEPKFRAMFVARFPALFVDEYQDTNAAFANSLKKHFLGAKLSPLMGFFGDNWQQIYTDTCGRLEHEALTIIPKGANFRSVKEVVGFLNNMRKELPQEVSDATAIGSMAVYHTNHWVGERRTDGHFKGDLPADVAHLYLTALRSKLAQEGWSFQPEVTKILMLTHNVLAKEQGYSSLGSVFERSESYIKKEDRHIAFFVDKLEPVCRAFESKRYGEMFSALDERTPAIRNLASKVEWTNDLTKLLAARSNKTIGEVLDLLMQTKRPRLPDALEEKARELKKAQPQPGEEPSPSLERLKSLRAISYKEVIALDQFIDERTPFSTKHGVKGAEFENVLVVVGRGWNLYDFSQMLEWFGTGTPKGKEPSFARNRNLFYVACSRPKKRLAIFFTQKLSNPALQTLESWAGKTAVHAFDPAPQK